MYSRNCCFEAWGILRQQVSQLSCSPFRSSICRPLSKIDEVGACLASQDHDKLFCMHTTWSSPCHRARSMPSQTKDSADHRERATFPMSNFVEVLDTTNPAPHTVFTVRHSLARHLPEFCIACSFSSLACRGDLESDPIVKCHNIMARSNANR